MASSFLFPLLTFPYLTRTLGAENYGIVVLSNAVMQYFQLLIDFGFILSGTAACSKYRDDKEKLQNITSAIVYSKLTLSIVGLVILSTLISTLDIFRGKELFIIVSYLPLIFTSFVPDFLFRGIEKMGTITFRTITAKLVYTAMIFILVRNADSYYFIPLSLAVSNLIIVLWSWSYIIKKLKMKPVRASIRSIRQQLKESKTFFASRIATTVYSASNIFVLGLFGYSDSSIGIYGAANTLTNYGKSMFSPVADSLYPYMVKNKNHKLVKKILAIMLPAIIIGCIALALLSPFVIKIMCGEEFMESVPYFQLMIPMLAMTLPSYLYGFPMLGSIGRNDKANKSVFIGAAFHFMALGILFLTRTLNFYNIIITTTITESIIMIYRVICFKKCSKNHK